MTGAGRSFPAVSSPVPLSELLAAVPADPPPPWPPVPAAPDVPGPPFEARRTDGTGQLVHVRPVPPTSDAGALWTGHRDRFDRTGLWPVLVDDAFWQAVELEPFRAAPAPPDAPDARALLRRFAGDRTDEDGGDPVRRGPVPEVEADARTPEQIVTGSETHTTLLLVPARASWVVPELLGWDGAVNHDVEGGEHSAVLGRWAGLFGAELFGLTRDVLQLLITRPPVDERSRLEAAAELYAYCPDVVDQGVETLEALTPMAASREWWLWWD